MTANANHINGDHPVLLPDREEPYWLKGVYEKISYGCRDKLVLDFGDSYLRFGVDVDWDTITAEFQGTALTSKRGYQSVDGSQTWEQYLNKPCGWTWFAINQQGYWDSVLISFEAVVPNVLLNVMASSIWVLPIASMKSDSHSVDARIKQQADHRRRGIDGKRRDRL